MKTSIRRLSALLAFMMVFALIFPTLAQADKVTILLGDANQDGTVNTADATTILKHCAELVRITDNIALIAADANQNGEVNTADATAVLKGVAFDTGFGTIETEIPGETPDESSTPTDEPIEESPIPSPSNEPSLPPSTEPPIYADCWVSVMIDPEDAGVVKINGRDSTSEFMDCGRTVTVECVPNENYQFIEWRDRYSNAFVSNEINYTFSAYQVTLVAICEAKTVDPTTPPTSTPTNTPTPTPTNTPTPTTPVWDGTIGTGFAGGNGTQSNPYIIKTGSQLAYLSKLVNYGSTTDHQGKYFALADDIYLNTNLLERLDSGNMDGLRQWIPIGNSSAKSFKGFFDGQGHKIHGLYINNPGGSYLGLFGYIFETSTTYADFYTERICNFTVDDAYVNGNNYVAGVIGCLQMKGYVSNVSFEGRVIASGSICGGIVGYVTTHFGGFTSCKSSGSITSTFAGIDSGSTVKTGVGGIVGHGFGIDNLRTYSFKDCVNYADISQDCKEPNELLPMGGICGYVDEIQAFENCVNFGNISGIKGTAGICGYKYYACSFINCANYGDISGTVYVAGISAHVLKPNTTFSGCANLGKITGSGQFIGGISGHGGSDMRFENCYNRGIIMSTHTGSNPCMAGISSASASGMVFMNCYNMGYIIPGNASATGVGAICSYSSSVSNCYALTGSCTNMSGASEKTDDWFKSDSAISLLGSAYVHGNDGYPILRWQA